VSGSRESVGKLHVITDEAFQDRFSHLDLARMAAEGGADRVQYREKRARSTRTRVRTARSMAEALAGFDTKLVVDDRVDVAAAVNGAGVHLGEQDLEPEVARRLLGTGALIGRTANSLEGAIRVAEAPVDYLGVGPVFGTRSKANPAAVLGLEGLAAIVDAVDLPVVAIGNITAERVAEVLSTGAEGIAVLAAVVRDPDPREATRRLRRAIDAWVANAPVR
jgi:thiamine-phosphate pyrophosphorylase